MTAYYSENDPHAAQWLQNLIDAGEIAPGYVDERDIRDVRPADLWGFKQCHFFAGIGAWSHALRRAGWPDDRPVWTGSCPCQSFSAAGKGAGFDDARHLWPVWFDLIRERRPPVVFGEQVSAAIRHGWIDLVYDDMEGIDYALGALVIPACSVGAPHIRERLFFVADAYSERRAINPLLRSGSKNHSEVAGGREAGGVANAKGIGLLGRPDDRDSGRRERASGQGREAGELEHAARDGREQWRAEPSERSAGGGRGESDRPGPTNGFWRDADWIGCTDGKWRPALTGNEPLVDGAAFKLGSGGPFAGKSRAKMLKGYGNAIIAPLAAEFIAAYLETEGSF